MITKIDPVHALTNIPLPPLDMIFIGLPDHTRFLEVGEHFLGHFKRLCDLKPSDHLLDVGSGIGRMAIPLAGYLNEQGSYNGVEIVEKGVVWCTNNISSRFSNFYFHHLDVKNDAYNPGGKFSASSVSFPIQDESVDFVFLCSVFTHMLPEDLKNYTQQIGRVLKPGGRYLITYFMLNDYSLQAIEKGQIKEPEKYCFNPSSLHEKCWIAQPDNPEWGVAYDQDYIYMMLDNVDLGRDKRFYPGAWTGRGPSTSFQDIVTGRKF